ncbi:uncharacterized protein BDFB_008144, partial [Asbolus verrucosus]
TTNSTIRRTVDDDYYLNYDYEISNNSTNFEFKSESLLLPNPESIDSKYTVDVLPNIELPDDSLSDTDLRDHDFIDNLMYVYYGSHNRNDNSYGPEISYLVSPHNFETKRFCFMSVQKGMIVNYMLPVSLLIVITTIYSLNGIRKMNIELSKLEFSSSAESLNALRNELDNINNRKQDGTDEEVISLRESKSCLKLLCGIQTGYDIVWFIAVLALENNSDNNSMSVVYSVTSCLLNWYIFLKAKSFLPSIICVSRSMDNVLLPQDKEKTSVNNEDSISRRGSSDSVPLLINAEHCTEMRELRLDFISTISN